MPNKKFQDSTELIKDLIKKSSEGRNIVPLLGAGVSIEAGVPSLASVARYLAKTQYYIENKIYRAANWKNWTPGKKDENAKVNTGKTEVDGEKTKVGTGKAKDDADKAEDDADKTEDDADKAEDDADKALIRDYSGAALDYISDFGWPDPYQLDSDLWFWLIEGAPDKERKKFGADPRYRMARLVESEFLENLMLIDYAYFKDIRNKYQDHADDQGDSKESGDGGSGGQESGTRLLNLKGGNYWKGLLSHLTRSSPDFIDMLFRQLVQRRQPATAHRFLALLAPVLRLRLFLTVNFDSLLEEALRIEELGPVVYEISDGAPLPHASLVQGDLSVLKLHGGAFGLRVGDRLDMPLDAESRQRILSYLPANPILLVLGIGGWDQRVLDIVELVHLKGGDIYWAHFEETIPAGIDLRFRTKDEVLSHIYSARVLDPGGFLRELHGRATAAHPPGRRPYRSLCQHPMPKELPSPAEESSEEGSSAKVNSRPEDAPVRIFDSEDASWQLIEYVASKAETHRPIWIDLEQFTGDSEIVVEIVSQLRQYDPTLPPEIVAFERVSAGAGKKLEKETKNYIKVLRRIYSALSRDRYILAFDGIEAFGRVPIQHHGIHSNLLTDEREAQIRNAEIFLFQLFQMAHKSGHKVLEGEIEWYKGELSPPLLKNSVLAFAFGKRCLRGDSSENKSITEIPELWRDIKRTNPKLVSNGELGSWEIPSWLCLHVRKYRLSWLFLTAFRHWPSIVALYQKMPLYLRLDGKAENIEEMRNDSKSVEKFLENLRAESGKQPKPLRPLADGRFWIGRGCRDKIYSKMTKNVGARALRGVFGKKSPEVSKVRVALCGLARLGAVHNSIALHYREEYLASRDAKALLEHFYHRTSSLRYFTKLQRCAMWSVGRIAFNLTEKESFGDLLGEVRLEEGCELFDGDYLNIEFFSRLRRDFMRTIYIFLWREDSRLLSKASGLALCRWAHDFRSSVLERFKLGECLDESSSKTLKELCQGMDKTVAEQVKRDEGKIEDGIFLLGDLLDGIQVEAYHDQMLCAEVLEVLHGWVERVLGEDILKPIVTAYEAILRGDRQAGADPRLMAKDIWSEFQKKRSQAKAPALAQLLSRHLGTSFNRRLQQVFWYAASALRRDSLCRESSALESLSNCVAKLLELHSEALKTEHLQIKSKAEEVPSEISVSSSDVAFSMVLRHLNEAARKLTGLDPWTIKQKSWPDDELPGLSDDDQDDLDGVVKLCEQAIRNLEWSREVSIAYRAHIHVIQGRALLLLCKWDKAERQFDKARGALNGARIGPSAARIEAFVATTIGIVESRLVESDYLILEWAAEHGGDFDIARHLKRPLASLRWIAGCSDLIDRLEEKARSEDGNLSSSWIGVLSGMQQRLASASDVLEIAERALERGRRNVEWWLWFFRHRAQLTVEELLLIGTDERLLWKGPGLRGLDPARCRKQRHTIERLVREGLRAVRQGLDIHLPARTHRTKERLAQDKLLRRFLCLWLIIGLAGAFLSWTMRWSTNRMLTVDDLWERWLRLNALEGLVHLPEVKGLKEKLKELLKDLEELLRKSNGDKDTDVDPRILRGLRQRMWILEWLEACLQKNPETDGNMIDALIVTLHGDPEDDKKKISSEPASTP